jgi:hypothetical protein
MELTVKLLVSCLAVSALVAVLIIALMIWWEPSSSSSSSSPINQQVEEGTVSLVATGSEVIVSTNKVKGSVAFITATVISANAEKNEVVTTVLEMTVTTDDNGNVLTASPVDTLIVNTNSLGVPTPTCSTEIGLPIRVIVYGKEGVLITHSCEMQIKIQR